MRIERIEREGRFFALWLEDETKTLLTKRAFKEANVKEGDEVDEEALRAYAHEDAITAAKESAVRILSAETTSEGLLMRKLRAKGFSQDAAENARALMKALDLLDDERYAELLVRSMQRKRKSKREIEWKLKEAFVSAEIRTRALQAVSEEGDAEALRALVKQYAGAYAQKEQLARFLLRRGFLSADIRRAIMEYENEKDEAL